MSKVIECGNCGKEIPTDQSETVDGGREQVKCGCGNILVECVECGDFMSVMNAASGPGRKPVHRDCFSTASVLEDE